MPYAEFCQHHPQKCIKKEAPCPLGCGKNVSIDTKGSHYALDCGNVLIECEFCWLTLNRDVEVEHKKNCTNPRPMGCDVCHQPQPMSEIAEHRPRCVKDKEIKDFMEE